MGSTRLIPVVVEFGPCRAPGMPFMAMTPVEWRSDVYGRATTKNLDKYVRDLVDSFKTGSANAQVGEAYGYIPVPSSARIVRQKDKKVLAEWKQPMFMVV